MIRGHVIRGDGVARQLGYPTANLDVAPAATKLRDGVYAAWATLHGIRYRSALVIQHEVSKVEVYILDYADGNFYDSVIEVDPVQKVSEIEHVPIEQLLKKMKNDIELVRTILIA